MRLRLARSASYQRAHAETGKHPKRQQHVATQRHGATQRHVAMQRSAMLQRSARHPGQCAQVEARLTPSGHAIRQAIPAVVSNAGDPAMYLMQFLPTQSGIYHLSFGIGSQWAPTKLAVAVIPSHACAALTKVSPPVALQAEAGKLQAYTIESSDAYGNQRWDDQYMMEAAGTTLTRHECADAPSKVAYVPTQAGSSRLRFFLAQPSVLAAATAASRGLAVVNNIPLSQPVDWANLRARSGFPDAYAVTWSGFVRAADPGVYTFQSMPFIPDERVRLWIDNTLVVDQWSSLVATAASGAIRFGGAAALHELKLEYLVSALRTTDTEPLRLVWAHGGSNGFQPIPEHSFTAVAPLTGVYEQLVTPAPWCCATSTVSGSGLTVATAGTTATFAIATRDSFGNPAALGSRSIELILNATALRLRRVAPISGSLARFEYDAPRAAG